MKRRDRVHDDAGEAVLATKRHKNKISLVFERAQHLTPGGSLPRQLELFAFSGFF